MSKFYPPVAPYYLPQLDWPYDIDPAFAADSGGDTRLKFDGSVWFWESYEWGEYNRKRNATDAEVIDTLTAAWVEMSRQAEVDADALNLGKAAARVFRGLLKE